MFTEVIPFEDGSRLKEGNRMGSEDRCLRLSTDGHGRELTRPDGKDVVRRIRSPTLRDDTFR